MSMIIDLSWIQVELFNRNDIPLIVHANNANILPQILFETAWLYLFNIFSKRVLYRGWCVCSQILQFVMVNQLV